MYIAFRINYNTSGIPLYLELNADIYLAIDPTCLIPAYPFHLFLLYSLLILTPYCFFKLPNLIVSHLFLFIVSAVMLFLWIIKISTSIWSLKSQFPYCLLKEDFLITFLCWGNKKNHRKMCWKVLRANLIVLKRASPIYTLFFNLTGMCAFDECRL